MNSINSTPVGKFRQAAANLAEKVFLSLSADAGRDLAKELTADAQLQAKNIIDALWESPTGRRNFFDNLQRYGASAVTIENNDKVSDAVILGKVKQYMEALGYTTCISCQTNERTFLGVTHPHPKTMTPAEMYEMAAHGRMPKEGISFPPNCERPDAFKLEQPHRRD